MMTEVQKFWMCFWTAVSGSLIAITFLLIVPWYGERDACHAKGGAFVQGDGWHCVELKR
jgi:hypothetical protein